MRRLFPLHGWRTTTLCLLALLAMVLLCNENEDWPAIILSRVAGVAVAIVAWLLGRHWDRQGKLPNIKE